MEEPIEQNVVSKDSGKGIHEETPNYIPVDPYANVQRELSEDELNSSAVQKLLINDHDRLTKEVDRLSVFVDKYHNRDKEAAILEEQLKKSKRSDILYTVCETFGSAIAGCSTAIWSEKGWILLILGLLLVLGGLFYKFSQK